MALPRCHFERPAAAFMPMEQHDRQPFVRATPSVDAPEQRAHHSRTCAVRNVVGRRSGNSGRRRINAFQRRCGASCLRAWLDPTRSPSSGLACTALRSPRHLRHRRDAAGPAPRAVLTLHSPARSASAGYARTITYAETGCAASSAQLTPRPRQGRRRRGGTTFLIRVRGCSTSRRRTARKRTLTDRAVQAIATQPFCPPGLVGCTHGKRQGREPGLPTPRQERTSGLRPGLTGSRVQPEKPVAVATTGCRRDLMRAPAGSTPRRGFLVHRPPAASRYRAGSTHSNMPRRADRLRVKT